MRFIGTGLAAVSIIVGLSLAPALAARPPLPPENPYRAAQVLPAPGNRGELSAEDWRTWRMVFATASARRFDTSAKLAGDARDQRLLPVLEWLRILDSGNASPDEIAAFLRAQPEFPSRGALTARMETAILESGDVRRIADHFGRYPALTSAGMLEEALLARAARPDRAIALARRVWRERTISAADEKRLLDGFGSILTADDHIARLDRLVWDAQRPAAERMKGLVDQGYWKLADARLRLRVRGAGVDAAIKAVPDALQADEGLLYERALWRRRAGLDEGVREILFGLEARLAEPARWWVERRIQIRELIALGRIDDAYRLASQHGLESGADFAEAEFQAGWLALRFLGRPDQALEHFRRLHDNVSFPVSVSRGAYWVARALTDMGQTAEAANWFARAARHGTTYYGQLAAMRLGETAISLPEEPAIDPAIRRAFAARPLVQIVRLLVEIDEVRLARLFVTSLGQSAGDALQRRLVGDLATSLDTPHLQVLAGKLAALDDTLLASVAYPLLPPLRDNGRIDAALAHAIARQESAFDPAAVSSAGARGLMQLMPATARVVAGWEQVSFEPRRLIDDPAYNARLGSAYLDRQILDFGGYLPMAIAAYNAGPHRVRRWIEAYGDPRTGEADPVDWIELIPFSETRNYVQRVLEALQVYRLRVAGHQTGRLHLLADLGIGGAGSTCAVAALLRLDGNETQRPRAC